MIETLTINVTQDDIESGLSNNATYCAIARSYKRQTGHNCAVAMTLLDQETGESFPLPDEAHAFIFEFDCGESVYPFSFELQPAQEPAQEKVAA